jgi:hypothetical protein
MSPAPSRYVRVSMASIATSSLCKASNSAQTVVGCFRLNGTHRRLPLSIAPIWMMLLDHM